jgi:hypothetical protein
MFQSGAELAVALEAFCDAAFPVWFVDSIACPFLLMDNRELPPPLYLRRREKNGMIIDRHGMNFDYLFLLFHLFFLFFSYSAGERCEGVDTACFYVDYLPTLLE